MVCYTATCPYCRVKFSGPVEQEKEFHSVFAKHKKECESKKEIDTHNRNMVKQYGYSFAKCCATCKQYNLSYNYCCIRKDNSDDFCVCNMWTPSEYVLKHVPFRNVCGSLIEKEDFYEEE